MAEEDAEVKIKLVADDQSADTLEKTKASFLELQESSKAAAEAMRYMATNAAQVGEHTTKPKQDSEGIAAGVLKGNIEFELMKRAADLVGESIKQAFEFTEKLAESAVEAAEAQEKQEKEMAGFLLVMDAGKHSMAQMREYTADMREEFETFGLKSGVAVKDLVDNFDKLVARGSMSSEKAKELTEQMAIVGRVVPGGIQALGQGMAGVEMGMVRARNPIVQLISATQTLHGNAKMVAQQMQHMSPERQMKLAEQAIAAQAENLKKMGAIVPDLGQLKTSFEGVKESFLESMGKPMVEELVPQLVRLRDFLLEHMQEIKAFGEKAGAAAAEVISWVSAALQGIYAGLTQNWDSFKETFNSIFQDWEDAWETSRTTTDDIKTEFEVIGKTFRDIFTDIMRMVKAAVEVAMDANDVLHGRSAGTTQAEIAQKALANEAKMPGADKKSNERFEHGVDEYRAKALSAGMDPKAVDEYAASMRNLHERFQQAGEQDHTAIITARWDKLNDAMRYNTANHQEALNDYILQQLNEKGSIDQVAAAIKGGALTIGASMDDTIKMLSDKAPELAAKLRESGNVIKNAGGITPRGGITFNGATFHIKQDFQDQNPDRIALIFKKEIGQAAISRTMARTATPFGL